MGEGIVSLARQGSTSQNSLPEGFQEEGPQDTSSCDTWRAEVTQRSGAGAGTLLPTYVVWPPRGTADGPAPAPVPARSFSSPPHGPCLLRDEGHLFLQAGHPGEHPQDWRQQNGHCCPRIPVPSARLGSHLPPDHPASHLTALFPSQLPAEQPRSSSMGSEANRCTGTAYLAPILV